MPFFSQKTQATQLLHRSLLAPLASSLQHQTGLLQPCGKENKCLGPAPQCFQPALHRQSQVSKPKGWGGGWDRCKLTGFLRKTVFFFFFLFLPGLRNLCQEALPHRFKKMPLGLQAAVDLLLSLSSPHRRAVTTNSSSFPAPGVFTC